MATYLDLGKLLPIKETNGNRAVNARDLHMFLEIGKDFSSWMKAQIERCDLTQNIDYEAFTQKVDNSNGIGYSRKTEYALSLNAAKEISMMSQTERGKQARRYFIACEEKLKQVMPPTPSLPTTYLEALKALVAAEEEKVQLQLANQSMQPKAAYFDNLVERNLLTNFRDTAKQIHIPQNKFIDLLLENKFLYRDQKGELKPYSDYTPKYFEMKDWERNGKVGVQVLVTPKGKEAFRLMWGGMRHE